MANQSLKLWFKKTIVFIVAYYDWLWFGTKTMIKTMKNVIVLNYDTHIVKIHKLLEVVIMLLSELSLR